MVDEHYGHLTPGYVTDQMLEGTSLRQGGVQREGYSLIVHMDQD